MEIKKKILRLLDKAICLPPVNDYSLLHGVFGYSIVCFVLYEQTKEEKYKLLAEKYLLEVFDEIGSFPSIDIKNGISGIGIGIIFLRQKNFLEGNIEPLLCHIDTYLYKVLNQENAEDTKKVSANADILVDVLIFLAMRIKYGNTEETEIKLLELFAMKILNALCNEMTYSFCDEPVLSSDSYKLVKFLWVFILLNKVTFFDNVLKRKILDLKCMMLRQIPLEQKNCFFLYVVYKRLISIFNLDEDWNEYANLLEYRFSISRIIKEIKDSEIYRLYGLAGVSLLLQNSRKGKQCLEHNAHLLWEKIAMSGFLDKLEDSLENIPKGIDGVLGFLIFYLLEYKSE